MKRGTSIECVNVRKGNVIGIIILRTRNIRIRLERRTTRNDETVTSKNVEKSNVKRFWRLRSVYNPPTMHDPILPSSKISGLSLLLNSCAMTKKRCDTDLRQNHVYARILG